MLLSLKIGEVNVWKSQQAFSKVNLLISSLPKEQIHEKCFSSEVRDLINALSFTYNLNTLDLTEEEYLKLTETVELEREILDLENTLRNNFQTVDESILNQRRWILIRNRISDGMRKAIHFHRRTRQRKYWIAE